MMIDDDPQEEIAAEARVYRDKDGGLWLDPYGDGKVFAFDRQCRTAMTERWGTIPMELADSQFGLAELAPVIERPDEWAVKWRFQGHMGWATFEAGSRESATARIGRLRDAGFEAELWTRLGAIGPGEWQRVEKQP